MFDKIEEIKEQQFIEEYKQRNPMSNERRALLSDNDE